MTDPAPKKSGDIPRLICEAFLAQLEGEAVDSELVSRLREALSSGRTTENDLRLALFPEESSS